jgi:hypothetical protein
MTEPSGFKWGTSHWLFTVVLILVVAGFVAFYAHVNYASTTGNQFLSVAATLASIILAVVAIFIAISQLIYASHQGNQLDLRLAELKSSVFDLRPIHKSVSDLTELVSNIKDEQKAFLSSAGKALLAEAPFVEGEPVPDVPVGHPEVPDRAFLNALLGPNTNLYFAALGHVIASNGRMLDVAGLRSSVGGLLDEDPNTESRVARRALPITVVTVVSLLKNFGVATIPESQEDGDDQIEIDEQLCKLVIERVEKIESKLREKGGSSTHVADLYKKILRRARADAGE